MDIIFHPKKYRDRWKRCDKDGDDEQIKLNCCCYLNCQIQSRDYFSVGKPYLRRYFDVVETYTPAVPTAEDKQHRYGVIMTEVFRVIIKIKGGGSGHLSGKIYFSNLNQHKYLYEQGKHGQYIKGKCDLLTTVSGRDHVIRSDDTVACFVDLLLSNSEYQPLTNCEIPQLAKQKPDVGHFDENGNFYDSNGTLCDFFEQKFCDMNDDDDAEDELDEYEGKGDFIRISNCKGCFGRNGRLKEHKFQGLAFSQFTHRHIFDKPQRYKVNSPDNKCSLTILYAFFREAVQATVELILKVEDSKEFGVYGLIAARNDLIKEDDYEIILFLKEDSTQSVPVISGEPIQLSRSLVAVPINSDLLVRVHLRTNDKHFPSAQLIFPAQQSGISELPINDMMYAKVTWEPFL